MASERRRAGQAAGYGLSGPGDDPQPVQPVRQGHEGREIDQRVPGAPIADHVVPVEDSARAP